MVYCCRVPVLLFRLFPIRFYKRFGQYFTTGDGDLPPNFGDTKHILYAYPRADAYTYTNSCADAYTNSYADAS